MTSLRDLIGSDTGGLNAISSYLDGLSAEARASEVRELGRREQAALYERAAGERAIGFADLVPKTREPLAPVRHLGKNTLPVFTRFAKVFWRPDDDGASSELWGYNENPKAIAGAVGPGYFVVVDGPSSGEVTIDYRRLPKGKPPSLPAIRDNDHGLSKLVYGGMEDVLRGVSKHVSIGRARKKGRAMDAWFVLCREE